MKIGTYIYSSASIDALKELLKEFFIVFNIPSLTPDDLFYYGVFCKDVTYANYKDWDAAPVTLDIPEQLTSPCQTENERLDYVHIIIDKVMKGKIDKPEWMIYVEAEETCNDYEAAPSNFLYLIPKDNEYERLGKAILNFLYSPNMMNYGIEYYK